MKIYYCDEIKVEDIELCDPHPLGNGVSHFLKYKGKPLYIQTPWLFTPNGATEYNLPTQHGWSIHCLLDRNDNAKNNSFIDFVENIEKLCEETAEDKGWDDTHCSSIKRDPEGNKKPVLRIKFHVPDFYIRTRLQHDGESQELTHDNIRDKLPPLAMVRGIIQLMPLWQTGDRYGVSYRLKLIETGKRKSIQFRQP